MANIDIANQRREYWRSLAVKWKMGYWASGSFAAIFAALGTMPDLSSHLSGKIFSGVATAILACTGFANPLRQFNERMKGYWILDAAILLYDLEKAKDAEKAERDLAASIVSADKAANGQT